MTGTTKRLEHEHLKFIWHNANKDDVFECGYCHEIIVRVCTCDKRENRK